MSENLKKTLKERRRQQRENQEIQNELTGENVWGRKKESVTGNRENQERKKEERITRESYPKNIGHGQMKIKGKE